MASLIEDVEDKKDLPPHYEEDIRNNAGAAYGAGSDTVSSITLCYSSGHFTLIVIDGCTIIRLHTCHGVAPGRATKGSS